MKTTRNILTIAAGIGVIAICMTVCHRGIGGADNAVQEIHATIGAPADAMIARADSLRQSYHWQEATALYENILEKTTLSDDVRKETEYDLALCHIIGGKFADAESIYTSLLEQWPGDGYMKAHIEYCRAWIDVQEERYDVALVRLQNVISGTMTDDKEILAHSQYRIGTIYGSFLNDNAKSLDAYRKVLERYPDSEAARRCRDAL